MAFSAERAASTLTAPTESLRYRIWRCRLVRSTLSESAMVSRPMPAAAR
jgi:hypothetical protein